MTSLDSSGEKTSYDKLWEEVILKIYLCILGFPSSECSWFSLMIVILNCSHFSPLLDRATKYFGLSIITGKFPCYSSWGLFLDAHIWGVVHLLFLIYTRTNVMAHKKIMTHSMYAHNSYYDTEKMGEGHDNQEKWISLVSEYNDRNKHLPLFHTLSKSNTCHYIYILSRIIVYILCLHVSKTKKSTLLKLICKTRK